jgi:predicted small lipoprotein YifL
VNRPIARPLRKLATLGLLAIALALGACGLKGPLDPPPAAATSPQAGLETQGTPPPGTQTPPRKRIFLDALLD